MNKTIMTMAAGAMSLSRYPTDGTTMDGSKHPGLRNTTGRLGWLSHGYPCRWRRIRIKELGK